MTAHQPAKVRRERRFEIGFFIRKIVNGWVVFYKQFPREQRAAVFSTLSGQAIKEDAPVAMSHSGSGDVAPGGVTAQSGTGGGPGDAGPIGSARIEVGFFIETVTSETTSDENSEDH